MAAVNFPQPPVYTAHDRSPPPYRERGLPPPYMAEFLEAEELPLRVEDSPLVAGLKKCGTLFCKVIVQVASLPVIALAPFVLTPYGGLQNDFKKLNEKCPELWEWSLTIAAVSKLAEVSARCWGA